MVSHSSTLSGTAPAFTGTQHDFFCPVWGSSGHNAVCAACPGCLAPCYGNRHSPGGWCVRDLIPWCPFSAMMAGAASIPPAPCPIRHYSGTAISTLPIGEWKQQAYYHSFFYFLAVGLSFIYKSPSPDGSLLKLPGYTKHQTVFPSPCIQQQPHPLYNDLRVKCR